MSIPQLTIIPAGAGSGKTYKIKSELYDWIDKGWVKPENVVAVTFTEAAAGELRSRIRSQLIEKGKLEEALKLDQAYISTIHGFGLRVLTEFAFAAGSSPGLRLLNESEQEALIRRSLAQSGEMETITKNLSEYGYRYSFMSQQGEEGSFRNRILDLIGKLKNIAYSGREEDMLTHALEKVTDIYGPTKTAEHLNGLLQVSVENLLKQFPEDLSRLFPKNKSASAALQKDYKNLKLATQKDNLQRWTLWKDLQELRESKRGSKLPDGYDDLAAEVVHAAANLPQHLGPLQQALIHVQSLLNTARKSLDLYEVEKSKRGLLDYQDMLAMAYDLLLHGEDVRSSLLKRVGCLVIDEFQDTNPLQFALLWILRTSNVPTLIVGDLKQAIMGFQGADPRLMEQLILQSPDACNPQSQNWRSQKSLMNWINELGTGLFGDNYAHLQPKADYPSSLAPIDVLNLHTQPRHRNKTIPAQHVASYVYSLLNDSEKFIFDRFKKQQRRIRGGDIAIICPTHARLEKYAEALRQLGIANRIDNTGWFESRAVQIAYHALCLVADSNDRHAQLYIAVTETGSHTLESALKEIIEKKTLEDPLINDLLPLHEQADQLSVRELVQEVFSTLDLYTRISLWPDSDQQRANLLRLQDEAEEFIHANRDALAISGYYGSGLKTFLAWLRNRVERDNKQPAPRVHDENAVELVTWHGSKGREWPIVIVAGMDSEVKQYLPYTKITYDNFANLGTILEQANLEIYPDFVAAETRDKFFAEYADDTKENAKRVLYVALSRAREKIVLECPTYQSASEQKSYWQLLQSWADVSITEDSINVAGSVHSACVFQCDKEEPDIFNRPPEISVKKLSGFGRRALTPVGQSWELTPEASTPSSMKDHEPTDLPELKLSTYSYADNLLVDIDLNDADRGTLIHRCYEVLEFCPDLESLSNACDFEFTTEQEHGLRRQVTTFNAWLKETLNPIHCGAEIPFLTQNNDASVVSGIIDLVVETEEGFWVIDHKSDRTDDREGRFVQYIQQLDAYATAIRKARPEKPVLGIGINWASFGEVMINKLLAKGF